MIKNISISIVVCVFLFVAFVNLPASLFSIRQYFTDASFGSTLTNISSTDNLADFPTVYNANQTALNNDKIEVSTTTLPNLATLLNLVAVGTITTGTWSADAIAVAKGGTGTTSPTSNLVMLGNGSSGLKTANGFGTSGQFLTSNGNATAPSWQTSSIDQGIPYTWTAHHIFSTLFATTASTTNLTFTGITSSLLKTSSVGLTQAAVAGTDYQQQQYVYADTTNITANNGFATSSKTLGIPAGIATASSTVEVTANFTLAGTNPENGTFYLKTAAGTTLISGTLAAAGGTHTGHLHINMFAENSTSVQTSILTAFANIITTSSDFVAVSAEGTSAVNFAAGQGLVLVLQADADDTLTVQNFTMKFTP